MDKEVVGILDWIFEGIITWIAKHVSMIMDAAAMTFLDALGTDLVTMEGYFPFVVKAFEVITYMGWALLFILVIWQLFRTFGGPLTDAEHPALTMGRGILFAFLIGYAKPIFDIALNIATVPYEQILGLTMETAADFRFSGEEGLEGIIMKGAETALQNVAGAATVVGLILMLILLISIGWNYFKLLLEAVERYLIVGVLCYTSPLAFCMGGTKSTGSVFKSWCRMVGSQLILLILNVWFVRSFNSSVGKLIATGGAIGNGSEVAGNVFLWCFCALGFLKIAQRIDSYLSALGLSVAQTGGQMGFEMIMAGRAITGIAGSVSRTAGSVFGGGSAASSGTNAPSPPGFLSGFVRKFQPNSYVRDAAVGAEGGRMGFGGAIGMVGRSFGGMAARNGAELNTDSIASVAMARAGRGGAIAGDIADRSLGNYMPHLSPAGHMAESPSRTTSFDLNNNADLGNAQIGMQGNAAAMGMAGFSTQGGVPEGTQFSGTEISGGRIHTTMTTPDGQSVHLDMYNAAQYEKPEETHTTVTAADGSNWYQVATGDGAASFYAGPQFTGSGDDAEMEMAHTLFPTLPEDTSLRSVSDGVLEAVNPSLGANIMYSSALYDKPDAPHDTLMASNGIGWYRLQTHADVPDMVGDHVAAFTQYMPGYEGKVAHIGAENSKDGVLEVHHFDGTGMRFYDQCQFSAPRGDYKTFESMEGARWYGVAGDAVTQSRPVYENGSPKMAEDRLVTENVATMRFGAAPARFSAPSMKNPHDKPRPPRRRG